MTTSAEIFGLEQAEFFALGAGVEVRRNGHILARCMDDRTGIATGKQRPLAIPGGDGMYYFAACRLYRDAGRQPDYTEIARMIHGITKGDIYAHGEEDNYCPTCGCRHVAHTKGAPSNYGVHEDDARYAATFLNTLGVTWDVLRGGHDPMAVFRINSVSHSLVNCTNGHRAFVVHVGLNGERCEQIARWFCGKKVFPEKCAVLAATLKRMTTSMADATLAKLAPNLPFFEVDFDSKGNPWVEEKSAPQTRAMTATA